MKIRFKPPFTFCLFVLLVIAAKSVYSQPAKLIDDHFKALANHDVKAIAAGYDDSAKVFSPNWEGAKTGPAGVTEVYTRYFASTPDLAYKVIHVINAGPDIVVEYTSSGTLSNPEGSTPAYMKDKKYALNYCAIFTIKNNKILKETDYFDQVAFLRQVGFFDQK
jgi:limonene-1,2-epoxide hydrolase